ncbi:hypothetical protein L1987_81623 [Smallanthus sonchifolius]|uniref:Uncharacterized protein n=1 Tax=Smallanthus sonchifolius TaxID=185202 RepID=A0ACB8YRE2_9ASTR|nr:hypothetical protein L1987_81623 [Smallanthus sonchifolius]
MLIHYFKPIKSQFDFNLQKDMTKISQRFKAPTASGLHLTNQSVTHLILCLLTYPSPFPPQDLVFFPNVPKTYQFQEALQRSGINHCYLLDPANLFKFQQSLLKFLRFCIHYDLGIG